MYEKNDYIFVPVLPAMPITNNYITGSILGVGKKDGVQIYLRDQIILYVNMTLGSLSSAQILVEFSDDLINWVQETIDDIDGTTGIITERLSIRKFLTDGVYRVPIKVNDHFVRISIKGIGTVTGSSVTIGSVVGNN